MENIDIKQNFKYGLIISSLILLFLFISTLKKTNNFGVFCDVGQGDAIYLRIESVDILVDAGPSKKVLECLGKNMPFWDKKIEIAILSHPQKDHFGGYLYILPRYKIEYFIMPFVEGSAQSFKKLEELLEKNSVNLLFPSAGEKIKVKKSTLVFLWPTAEFVNTKLSDDLNNYSLIFKLQTKNSSILFTGDAGKEVLKRIALQLKENSEILKSEFLKIPHHGSKNSLSPEFIKLADPRVAVISVGKNNSYNHPHQSVLNLLKALKIEIWRTDTMGNLWIEL